MAYSSCGLNLKNLITTYYKVVITLSMQIKPPQNVCILNTTYYKALTTLLNSYNLNTTYYKVVTTLLYANQTTIKFVQPCCKLATTKKDIHKVVTTLCV